jgi:hypothetical protein
LKGLKSVWEDLTNWRIALPRYLDWTRLNSAFTTQSYLKLQRAFLEIQFQCLTMKLAWSVGHLDPIIVAKFQPIWDAVYMNKEAIRAGQRVFQIITELSISSSSVQFFHWEAVRATLTLCQTLFRYDVGNGQDSMAGLLASCQEGIEICRGLIPKASAHIEDNIDKNFKE